jgi:predicted pyridoxine 5'-phosphate oxidase superfamily flavin-nucleotide-binding protein
MPCVLTDEVRQAARRSVLCWLATVDDHGQPNVSPKEVWAIADDQHVVVANIASPEPVLNFVCEA